MGKRMAMMTLVLWAAVTVDVCWCFSSSISSGDLVGENKKVKLEELKKRIADRFLGGYTQSFGPQVNAREAAARATDTVNTAVSEASKYASEKTGEAANKAYETADHMKNFASEKADQVIRMVSEGSTEGGQGLEKAVEYAMDKSSNAYDETKQKMNMASDRAYKAKESTADAIARGRSRAVDAYDMHLDWSDDDDDNDHHSKGRAVDTYDMHSDWSDDDDNDAHSDTFHHTMSEAIDYGRSRINNAYEEAKRITDVGIDMAMEKGADAKEAIEEAVEHAKEGCNHVRDEATSKAGGAMEHAINGDKMEVVQESVNKASKAYESAKEKMTGEAKAAYEDAKEKLSKASGAVGDKMRKDEQEL